MARNHISLPSISLALAALLCVTPSDADATFTVTIQADLLKDVNGNAIPQTALYLLVASTTDNVFSINNNINAGLSTAIGSLLGGDEMIVGRGSVSGLGINGVLNAGSSIVTFAGNFDAGNRLALLWFPTLTASDSTLVTGARFGFYDGGTETTANNTDPLSGGVDGSDPWIAPPDQTSSYSLLFFTQDSAFFPHSANSSGAVAGRATGTILVPEPSVTLIGLVGALGLLGCRRRSRQP